MKVMQRGVLLVGGLIACVCLSARPSFAHRRDFVWTYDWFTPAKGEQEIETKHDWVPADGMYKLQAEYEYGVTDHYSIAPYAIFETERGNHFHFNGGKLEQRYAFGEYDTDRFLPAAYLEVAKETDEPWELEGKLILSRYHGDADFSLNLISEKELRAGENYQYGYALGYSQGYTTRTRLGMEAFGNFDQRQHYVGPIMDIDVTGNTRVNLGVAFGLTRQSQSVMVRAISEFEWFD